MAYLPCLLLIFTVHPGEFLLYGVVAVRSNHSFGQDGTYLFGFPSYAPILVRVEPLSMFRFAETGLTDSTENSLP